MQTPSENIHQALLNALISNSIDNMEQILSQPKLNLSVQFIFQMIQIAWQRGHMAIVKMLLSYSLGIDNSGFDFDNRTILVGKSKALDIIGTQFTLKNNMNVSECHETFCQLAVIYQILPLLKFLVSPEASMVMGSYITHYGEALEMTIGKRFESSQILFSYPGLWIYSNLVYLDPDKNNNFACIGTLINESRAHHYMLDLLLENTFIRKEVLPNVFKQVVDGGNLDYLKIMCTSNQSFLDFDNNYAIRKAAHIDVVKFLLSQEQVDPTADDNAALRSAIKNGNIELVKLLLTHPKLQIGHAIKVADLSIGEYIVIMEASKALDADVGYRYAKNDLGAYDYTVSTEAYENWFQKKIDMLMFLVSHRKEGLYDPFCMKAVKFIKEFDSQTADILEKRIKSSIRIKTIENFFWYFRCMNINFENTRDFMSGVLFLLEPWFEGLDATPLQQAALAGHIPLIMGLLDRSTSLKRDEKELKFFASPSVCSQITYLRHPNRFCFFDTEVDSSDLDVDSSDLEYNVDGMLNS